MKGLAALAAVLVLGGQAKAAELTVFTGGSMLGPLKAAAEDYTRATGVQVRFASGTTGVISGRVRAGEPVDVIVISAEGLAALQAAGLTAPEAPTPLAKAILGVAVKAAAPRPDISTAEAFKAAVLKAGSIAYPDPKIGATSGVYLQDLFGQLGIGEAAWAKTTVFPDGAHVAAAVGEGREELGLTFISELQPDRTVEVVGPLPEGLQKPMGYDAALAVHAADPKIARAFIAFVTSAAEKPKLKAAGVEP